MGGLLERIQNGVSIQDVPVVCHAAGSHGVLVPSGFSGGQDCSILAFPDRGSLYPSGIERLLVPSVTTMDVSSAVSLKNACLLLPIAFKNSLAMLAVIALFYGVCYLLLPFTLPVILLFSFSCERLILCLRVQPSWNSGWFRRKNDTCKYSVCAMPEPRHGAHAVSISFFSSLIYKGADNPGTLPIPLF